MYSTAFVELLRTHERSLLDAWIGAQRAAGMRIDLLDETTILANSAELLRRITVAAAQGLGNLRSRCARCWSASPSTRVARA